MLKHLVSRWLPVLLWMGLIFFLSSRSDLPTIGDHTTDFIAKKDAHAFVYAVLAFLLLRATSGSTRPALYAFAIAALYAVSDEFHQTFVFRREGTLRDIGIDAAAAALALVVVERLGLRRALK
ncbi:MAG: VanZ family protein [Chloroflexi bacterium]|nr:VanZ family protein [Chloroflexota bacterium]